MRYFGVFIALALASCVTKPKSFSSQFCDDFLIWAESGPRQNSIASTRQAHFPKSSNCYSAGSADDNTDIFSCLTINWECPNEEECFDEADTAFLKAAYRRSHHWTEFSYFQNMGTCIGVIKSAASWSSSEADKAHSYSVQRNGDRFNLEYDPDERIARVEILYDAKNK